MTCEQADTAVDQLPTADIQTKLDKKLESVQESWSSRGDKATVELDVSTNYEADERAAEVESAKFSTVLGEDVGEPASEGAAATPRSIRVLSELDRAVTEAERFSSRLQILRSRAQVCWLLNHPHHWWLLAGACARLRCFGGDSRGAGTAERQPASV